MPLWKKFEKPEKLKDVDLTCLDPNVFEYLVGDSNTRMRYDHYLDIVASKHEVSAYYYRAGIRPLITAYDKWKRTYSKYEDIYDSYMEEVAHYDANFTHLTNAKTIEKRLTEWSDRINNYTGKLEKYAREVIDSIDKCKIDPRKK